MNKSNDWKLLCGLTGMGSLVAAANVLAQSTNAPAVTAAVNASDPNILYAMFAQVLNNPSSLLVVAFLCVFAWLADDLPFINSRYVAHCTVIMGALIYWAFTNPSSVPANFPHPWAVFIANGTLCGFVAFVIHKQAVARIINLVRAHAGDAAQNDENPTKLRDQNPPNQT